MKPFTDFERHMLSQAVPSLDLPALIDPSEIDLAERASKLHYGDEDFCKRGEGNLVSLCKILGVLPATLSERMECIHGGHGNDQ